MVKLNIACYNVTVFMLINIGGNNRMIKKSKFTAVIATVLLLTAVASACSLQKTSATKAGENAISDNRPELAKEEGILNTSQTTDQAGFDSPESAVKAYLEGLRDSDLKRMTDTFSENINLDNIIRQYTILCGLELEAEGPVSLNNPAAAKAFAENLESHIMTVDFKAMKLMGFVDPEDLDEEYSNQKHQENLCKVAQRYGGDKIVSCVAAVEVGNIKYFLVFDVLRKEGRWFNQQMGGVFANMLGIDRKAAGTLSLENADEKTLKKLIPDFSRNLLETGNVSGTEKSSAPKLEAEGFDSPQMAAKSYLENLAANEQDKMIGTFAVESYVDHFDFQTRLESSGAYIFMQQGTNLPVISDFTRDLNIQSRKEKIQRNFLEQYEVFGVLSETDVSDLNKTGEQDITSALSELPKRLNLSSIKILGYIIPDQISDSYGSDDFQNLRLQSMKVYGADKGESVATVFEFNGIRFLSCIDTVKYEDRWYIRELGGELSKHLGFNSNYAGIMPLEFLDNLEIDQLILPFS